MIVSLVFRRCADSHGGCAVRLRSVPIAIPKYRIWILQHYTLPSQLDSLSALLSHIWARIWNDIVDYINWIAR